MDMYVINPSDPKSDRMIAQLEGRLWVPYDWSPDDRKALVYQHISANENNLWVIDVTTGEKSLLIPKDGAGQTAYWLSQFSKDGKGVYVTTDRDSEFQRLAYIDLVTRRYKFLTDRIKADVDEFDLSLDGKTLAFVTNEEGIGRLRLPDTETCKERAAPDLPVGVVSEIKWRSDGRELGFCFTSARYPSDIYSYDILIGKLERWTYSAERIKFQCPVAHCCEALASQAHLCVLPTTVQFPQQASQPALAPNTPSLQALSLRL
jgi:prolyl oligopeptidase family protein